MRNKLRHRHHLKWIDFRQCVKSVETDIKKQHELTEFKVCLNEIKRSRPFLIVLLCGCYRWVSPSNRMEFVAREAIFPISMSNKNVTALEIKFCLFKRDLKQKYRCFYLEDQQYQQTTGYLSRKQTAHARRFQITSR